MNDKIIDCVYAAIDEANEERGDKPPLEKSIDTPLHGDAGGLDSLALVNFVLAVEDNVESAFGSPVMLSDDRALSQDPSPFQSVGALAEYIETLLEESR